MIRILVSVLVVCTIAYGAVIPIRLDDVQDNVGNLEFAVLLPNNDTIEIGISLKLLTISKPLEAEKNPEKVHYQSDTPSEETTTSTEEPKEKSTPKFISVEKAIEAFRANLLRKEKDIGGIIESKHAFYRHFKLHFDEDIELTIRCTYDSNYEKRSIYISCYEYHEYETERILSNGEVEKMRIQDVNFKSDVEFINFKSMKQVLNMDFS